MSVDLEQMRLRLQELHIADNVTMPDASAEFWRIARHSPRGVVVVDFWKTSDGWFCAERRMPSLQDLERKLSLGGVRGRYCEIGVFERVLVPHYSVSCPLSHKEEAIVPFLIRLRDEAIPAGVPAPDAVCFEIYWRTLTRTKATTVYQSSAEYERFNDGFMACLAVLGVFGDQGVLSE